MAVTENDLRRAVARFAGGVTIVAVAGDDGQPRGMTVSAFMFVSFAPALILVSLASGVPTAEAVRQRGLFGVSILGVDQQQLSDRFAGEEEDRFDGVSHQVLASGAITMGGAIGSLECRVQQETQLGDHTLVAGEVQGAAFREGRPLLYYRGKYGSFHTLTTSRTARWPADEEPTITDHVAYWH